jgi:hypothetical protein
MVNLVVCLVLCWFVSQQSNTAHKEQACNEGVEFIGFTNNKKIDVQNQESNCKQSIAYELFQ